MVDVIVKRPKNNNKGYCRWLQFLL